MPQVEQTLSTTMKTEHSQKFKKKKKKVAEENTSKQKKGMQQEEQMFLWASL